jgi:Cu/Ag efflux pump CusA
VTERAVQIPATLWYQIHYSPNSFSIMTSNMGSLDRMIRIAVAAIIAILYFMGQITGTLAIVLGVVAIAFALTSAISWCPLYLPFGLSTLRKKL